MEKVEETYILALERLDKIIASMSSYSRKDVKKLIREGKVYVSGKAAASPEMKVDPEAEPIVVNGANLSYQQNVYLMLNKPAGFLSATEDGHAGTVLDLIPAEYRKRGVFPVGRLDKDTEGLLLITDDGELAHNLLSPKKHVDKTYYVKTEGILTEADRESFRKGIILADGYPCMSADLQILQTFAEEGPGVSEALITIREGKFHQIKRMLETLDKPVLYLKRLRMGTLVLDETLCTGGWRMLTEEEISALRSIGEGSSTHLK